MSAKIDPALLALAPGGMVDVIVSVARTGAPGASMGDRAAWVAQAQAQFDKDAAPLLAQLTALAAGNVRPLWLAHAVAARIPHAALAALAAEDTVTRIAPDTERKMI
jgi:hypothetical protein